MTTQLDKLVTTLNNNGGFTWDVRNSAYVTEGYALSVDPDLTRVFDRPISASDIHVYMTETWDKVHSDNKQLGAWLDTETGKTHLDVVTVLTDKTEAIKLGRYFGEIAIFDLSAGEEIRLSYRIGEGDPFPWDYTGPKDDGPVCSARRAFLCSMFEGHNSPHVAGNGVRILEVWAK